MKFLQALPIVLSLASSTLAQSFCSSASHSGQSVKETGNKVGQIGNVGYEMWADSGNNSATFYSDGSFSCSFSNAKDYLCRSGLSFDSTQTHSQIGHMYADFKLVKQNIQNVDYSYVGIYGWTRSPLVEYYIVDNWLSQSRPGDWVGNQKHGDFTIDGAEYTVFENTRTGPSIDGDTTFKQYFSIRKTARECGTIDISAHFEQWEKLGMTMGKMHEAKVLGEAGSNGAGTSGTADFPYAKVYIGQGNGGGNSSPAPDNSQTQQPDNSQGQQQQENPPAQQDNNGGWNFDNNNNNNNGGWDWNNNNNNANNGGWDWNNNNNNNGGWDWNNNNNNNNNNGGWDWNNNNNGGWNNNNNNNGGWDWNNNNNNNGGWDWNNNNNNGGWNWASNNAAANNAAANNAAAATPAKSIPNQNNAAASKSIPNQNNAAASKSLPTTNASAGNNSGNCQALWGQCGGQGYNGPTCCKEGACVAINEYFHQCQQ